MTTVRRKRARLALAVVGLAGLLIGVSGCASARAAAEEAGASRVDDAEPLNQSAEDPGSTEPTGARPLTAPADPWTDRAEGTASPPTAHDRVRLVLPSSRLEPVTAEQRPALPPRARLALVTARDAWLVRAARTLLALGRELDDARLEPVVGLGPLRARREIDLEALALEADAQGFDLLLVDVHRGGGEDRDGFLLHAATGVLLAVFEVRGGTVPIASGGDTGDDLLDHVGQAYARAR